MLQCDQQKPQQLVTDYCQAKTVRQQRENEFNRQRGHIVGE